MHRAMLWARWRCSSSRMAACARTVIARRRACAWLRLRRTRPLRAGPTRSQTCCCARVMTWSHAATSTARSTATIGHRCCAAVTRRSTTVSRPCSTSSCGRSKPRFATSSSCTSSSSRRSALSVPRTRSWRTQSRTPRNGSLFWKSASPERSDKRDWSDRSDQSVRKSSRFALIALIALIPLIAGCARLFSSYDVAPDGLQRSEYEFRHYLSAGHADSALLQLTNSRKQHQLPKDDLLRLLFEGVAAHYAGDYQRSTAVFDRAALVAEDR